jgi:hypothetical protein
MQKVRVLETEDTETRVQKPWRHTQRCFGHLGFRSPHDSLGFPNSFTMFSLIMELVLQIQRHHFPT